MLQAVDYLCAETQVQHFDTFLQFYVSDVNILKVTENNCEIT